MLSVIFRTNIIQTTHFSRLFHPKRSYPSTSNSLYLKESLIFLENLGTGLQYVILIIKITIRCVTMNFLSLFISWNDTNMEIALRSTISILRRIQGKNNIHHVRISSLMMDFSSSRPRVWWERFKYGIIRIVRKLEQFSWKKKIPPVILAMSSKISIWSWPFIHMIDI